MFAATIFLRQKRLYEINRKAFFLEQDKQGSEYLTKVLIHTAVIFSDRHIVVVNYDNKITVKFCSNIKTLKRFTATERTVAYNCDYIFLVTL